MVSECDAGLNETRLVRQELALLMDEMVKMNVAQATHSAEIVQLKDEIEQGQRLKNYCYCSCLPNETATRR